MSGFSAWSSGEIDQHQPSAARVYDYLLGGGSNFTADRELAEKLMALLPAREMAMYNRSFLRRAVLFMVEAGVTQFLDLGSGIPTVGNVHEIAQQAEPGCRVVYVDRDAIAIAHSQHILEGNDNAIAIRADIRDTRAVLRRAAELIDFGRPVGLLAIAVMHFVEDPWDVLAPYRAALAPGSYLAVSTVTADHMPDSILAGLKVVQGTQNEINAHTHAEVVRMLGDFRLVEPGVVVTPLWRPERRDGVSEADIRKANVYAGVACKCPS